MFGIREVDLVEEALEVKTGKVLELRRDINGDGGQRRRGLVPDRKWGRLVVPLGLWVELPLLGLPRRR